MSNLEKRLKQLAVPYKKNDAYINYKENKGNKVTDENVSLFWDTETGYVARYKNGI